MMRLVLYLLLILILFFPKENSFTGAAEYVMFHRNTETLHHSITAMEALDLVKIQYAANFEKVYPEHENLTYEEYYYKLPIADYYLVYEGRGETEQNYLIHLYEFVLDEPDTGIGHTVTYGWYTVNRESGIITDQMQEY